MFRHGFEKGLAPWAQTGDLFNWGVTRVTGAAFAGRYGLRVLTGKILLPPVGDGEVTARVPNGYDRRATLDVRWRFVLRSRLKYVTFRLDGARSDESYGVGVRYDTATSYWYLWVRPGLWDGMPGNPTRLGDTGWHRIRLVVDWSTGYYVRFVVDSKEYAVSGRRFETAADGSDTECKIVLGVTSVDGLSTGAEYDEVLLYDGDGLRYV